jgi:hypothetical protein
LTPIVAELSMRHNPKAELYAVAVGSASKQAAKVEAAGSCTLKLG